MSDVFRLARQTSLASWFDSQFGEPAFRQGAILRYHQCPACGEQPSRTPPVSVDTNREKWFCHRCSGKGDVIDAEAAYTGASALEAAKALAGEESLPRVERAPAVAVIRQQDSARQAAIELVIAKLREAVAGAKGGAGSAEAGVRAYLANTRSIPHAVIDEALAAGTIGFLPANAFAAKALLEAKVGRPLLEAAGMWPADKKVPALAFKPLVAFMGPGAVEFRSIDPAVVPQYKINQYGRGADKMMVLPGSIQRATVVEGVIDLLSARAMGSRSTIVGLPGCKSWSADLFKRLAERTGITHYIVAFDNDVSAGNPGQAAAAALEQELAAMQYTSKRYVPPAGLDLNDVVRARRAAPAPPVQQAA